MNKNKDFDAQKPENEIQNISTKPLCGNKRNRDKTKIKEGKSSKKKFKINHDEEFEDSLFLNDNETKFNYLVDLSLKDNITIKETLEIESCKKFLNIIKKEVICLSKVDHSNHLNKTLKSFQKKTNKLQGKEEEEIIKSKKK
jgi:hypothetical protein